MRAAFEDTSHTTELHCAELIDEGHEVGSPGLGGRPIRADCRPTFIRNSIAARVAFVFGLHDHEVVTTRNVGGILKEK